MRNLYHRRQFMRSSILGKFGVGILGIIYLMLAGCADFSFSSDSSIVRNPPGYECPEGQFLGGMQPDLFCMNEATFESLFGAIK